MKLRAKLFVLCCTMFIFGNLYAQGEADNWYFGSNAGLNFSTGTPVALTDGQLNTLEGCATISNSDGDLLFYTDGITIWDKNHVIMPNGTGLQGDSSSSQSGIIVPYPGNSDLYYVFCVDHAGDDGGLYYSVIDMTLNNGSGDVITTQKNINLLQKSAEKIAAIEGDNNDFWVLSFSSIDGNGGYFDTIHTFNINDLGISQSVKSNVQTCSTTDGRGYLKISPDASKIAICNQSQQSMCYYDFDNTTGYVTNEDSLAVISSPYSAEFSLSSEKLYVSTGEFQSSEAYLFQFNLTSSDVQNSRVQIHSEYSERAALQLAIDKKIYYARPNTTFLGVINDPEADGLACDYDNEGVSLNRRNSAQGLPPFIQSYFLVDIEAINTCLGDVTDFFVDSEEPIQTILWDFGDGSTSTAITPSHIYANSGQYTVNVTLSTAHETKTNQTTVTIYDVPEANQPSTNYLCDVFHNNREDFNLSINDTTILGTQSSLDFNITYHISQEDADNNIDPLNSPYNSSEATIYARIENRNNTDCYDTTSFELNLYETFDITVTALEECDTDNNGFLEFNLLNKNAEVYGVLDVNQYTISYHLDLPNAVADTNPLPNTYTNVIQDIQTIYVRLENNSTGCFEIADFDLIINYKPELETSYTFYQCDYVNQGDEIEEFNLESYYNIVDNENNLLTYHLLLNDAELGVNPMDNIYSNISNPQTIYVRAQNPTTLCVEVALVSLEVIEVPSVPFIELTYCDDDNDTFGWFNLEDATMSAQNGNPSLTVTYYETLTQAELGVGANIDTTGLYQNIDTDGDGFGISQVVYIRVEGNRAGCYTIAPLYLTVLESPELPFGEIVYNLCEDNGSNDGYVEFDLMDYALNTLGLDPTLTIQFFTGLDTSGNPIGFIPNFNNYTNVTTPDQVIYLVVSNANTDSNGDACTIIRSMTLHVDLLPNVPVLHDIFECDDDYFDEADGIYPFNLSAEIDVITGGVTGLVVEFYEVEADAQAGSGPSLITNPSEFYNTLGPGGDDVFARVYDASTGCAAITHIKLHVDANPTPLSNQEIIDQLGHDGVMEECDGNVDGSGSIAEQVAEFDLTSWETLILTGTGSGIETGVSASYYTSYEDADGATNAIGTPDAYTNTSNPQTIYVRVTSDGTGIIPQTSGTGCYTIVQFDIFVPVPDVSVSGDTVLCVDENGVPLSGAALPVLTASPSTGGYEYQWALNGVDIPGAINETHTVTEAGVYTVTVSGPMDYDCVNSASITVEESGMPSGYDANVTTTAFADNHQIQATATSNIPGVVFYYTLDLDATTGIGVETNTTGLFTDVGPGLHYITITDGKACWSDVVEVLVIDYPHFFTPNGDGVNDTWQIIGVEGIPISIIYIFDRYGKLITQLDPDGTGWDGTYNGHGMPAGDYWFTIDYTEGAITPTQKEFKNHFSIKR